MTDPIAETARAAAVRLADEYGPGVLGQVEAELNGRTAGTYFDPVAIGGLVVAVASLAWTVYADLKKKTPKPDPEVVARAVRVQLDHPGTVDVAVRDNVIAVVVSETARIGSEGS
jgi:hypothetical protein